MRVSSMSLLHVRDVNVFEDLKMSHIKRDIKKGALPPAILRLAGISNFIFSPFMVA
jgi:hypothetical protein